MGIQCDHCKESIEKKEDLVVTSKYAFFMIRKYHRKCMADMAKMKTLSSGLVSIRPINGMQSTILLIATSLLIWVIAAAFPLVIGAYPVILLLAAIIAIIPLPGLAVRLYSYVKYERPLGD